MEKRSKYTWKSIQKRNKKLLLFDLPIHMFSSTNQNRVHYSQSRYTTAGERIIHTTTMSWCYHLGFQQFYLSLD